MKIEPVASNVVNIISEMGIVITIMDSVGTVHIKSTIKDETGVRTMSSAKIELDRQIKDVKNYIDKKPNNEEQKLKWNQ